MPQFYNKQEYEEWKAKKLLNRSSGVLPSKNREMSRLAGTKEKVGLFGVIAVSIGVFLPFFKSPVIGGVTYFGNGEGDAVMLLVASVISLVLILINRMKWIWLSGGWGLVTFTLSLYNFQTKMTEIQGGLSIRLTDNPVKQYADAMGDAIQLEVGVPVLIIGISMILLSAYLNSKNY